MHLVFPVISFLTKRIIQEIYNSNRANWCSVSGSFGSSLGVQKMVHLRMELLSFLFSNNYRNGDISTFSSLSLTQSQFPLHECFSTIHSHLSQITDYLSHDIITWESKQELVENPKAACP
jgi:hypothetical protein